MEPEKKSNGALIGLIIIVIILIVGGIYIAISNKSVIEKTVNSEIDIQTNQEKNSTTIDSLEEDLQSADIDLNIDVNNIQ